MEHAQGEVSVIERLMGMDLPPPQQPVKKCRLFSDDYLQKRSSLEIRRKQEVKEKCLSWMETDEFVFHYSFDVSTCSSMEQKLNIGGCLSEDNHQPSAGFLGMLEVTGEGDKDLSENRYCSSTSKNETQLTAAKSDAVKQTAMRGQLDSSRLVHSLEDYLAGNRRRVQRDDNKSKANKNKLQSFKFRRRIYMDPDREVAAQIRCRNENEKSSNSKLDNGYSLVPTLVHPNESISDVSFTNEYSGLAMKDEMKCTSIVTEERKMPPLEATVSVACQSPSNVHDGSTDYQDSILSAPGIALETFLSPESLSPTSLEESCQCSPVSVLQSSSYAGALSALDHFKHVSTELQEMRMQLQLLGHEFLEEAVSSLTAFSDNEDNLEDIDSFPDSIRFCYFADALDLLGYTHGNSESYTKRIQAEEPLINPNVFELLGKKYDHHASWKRSERRLFLDLINKCLSDSIPSHSGISNRRAPLTSKLTSKHLEPNPDELWDLLINLEHEATEIQDPKKVLVRDPRWLDLREDIQAIASELESLLIHGLIEELFHT